MFAIQMKLFVMELDILNLRQTDEEILMSRNTDLN